MRRLVLCLLVLQGLVPRSCSFSAQPLKSAFLLGNTDAEHVRALELRGFEVVISPTDEQDNNDTVAYRYNVATGMLQRVSGGNEAPTWIPLQDEQENLLVHKGCSFLDTDASEPQSSFDIDAANVEGTYQPVWGSLSNDIRDDEWELSALGWDITPWSKEQVQQAVQENVGSEQARRVLLEGATDPPGVKETNNGFVLRGIATSDIPAGIFTSAVTGIPLFTTADLSVTSTHWLSFGVHNNILAESHLRHVTPDESAMDRRVEVVEAASGCHLGHYFEGDSYCINASCLNFIPLRLQQKHKGSWQGPTSYRIWQNHVIKMDNPSCRLLQQAIDDYTATKYSSLVLGAGCFWHVEAALQRLPGVVDTTVGYAGGTAPNPTYDHVCSKERSDGYAEVVKVTFDPTILPLRQLVDCFLALHDPTKVRAHGKHAALTGQYRSCVFLGEPQHEESVVQQAIHDCQQALGKEVGTQVATGVQFWEAEDRHQRYEERRDDRITEIDTLSTVEWLKQYGRRKPSVMGSAQTLEESVADSRFYI